MLLVEEAGEWGLAVSVLGVLSLWLVSGGARLSVMPCGFATGSVAGWAQAHVSVRAAFLLAWDAQGMLRRVPVCWFAPVSCLLA